MKHLREAMKTDRQSPRVWLLMGTLALAKDNTGMAITCAKRLITFNPKMPNAWHMMASALQKEGRTDDAQNCLQKAREITGMEMSGEQS